MVPKISGVNYERRVCLRAGDGSDCGTADPDRRTLCKDAGERKVKSGEAIDFCVQIRYNT